MTPIRPMFPLALACAWLVACASGASRHEIVRGVGPLAKDTFKLVSEAQFERGSFQASDGTIIPYRLLAPSRFSADRRYPLVVQFHGSGGIGTDNVGQIDRLAKSWAMPDVRDRYQVFVLVPQFPARSANYGPPTPQQKSEPSPAMNAAMELVQDFTARQAVDPQRIYAAGFSMGGSAAWLAPALEPSLFAAVVPISGIAPDDSLASDYVDLPVLVLHGSSDGENPIVSDRRFHESIKRAGGRKIILREYEGLDHQPPGDTYPGFWWRDWLLMQTRGVGAFVSGMARRPRLPHSHENCRMMLEGREKRMICPAH